jgi:2-polyprenyl-6-methoxyphenol hydroxylase-like FAD-dependent oxidoreductase
MTKTLYTQVVIAGAGPAGLTISALLARYGIQSVLLEKHPGTSIYPRATSISTRTMEILRSLGLEADVRSASFGASEQVAFRASLVAPESQLMAFGFPTREAALVVSPTWPAVCAQDVLEPILLQHARSLGAVVRFSTELRDIEPAEGGVVVHAVDRRTGEALQIHARYAVGSDGTRSTVRRLAGIPFDGEEKLGRWWTVLFRADLKRRIPGPLAVLYVIDGSDHETIFLPTDKSDRWVFAIRLPEGSGERFDATDLARVRRLIRQASGVDDLEIEVLDSRTFYMGAQVARRFRSGNVFLAGDAAHRMTPSGGMGLNTAVHDAHNLAWKLAFVLNGWAGESLLDSYEAERKPVGERNTRRSTGEEPDRRPDGLDADIAYPYRSIAVISKLKSTPPDPTRLLSGEPGTRMPHFWLVSDGMRQSSLDLVGNGYLLLTGPEGGDYRDAAAEVAHEMGVPLGSFMVSRGETPDGEGWQAACGIGPDGALLVRPDGFIAWRSRNGVPYAARRLREVLASTLALSRTTADGAHARYARACAVRGRDMHRQHAGAAGGQARRGVSRRECGPAGLEDVVLDGLPRSKRPQASPDSGRQTTLAAQRC